jgi:hypothetical protein
LMISVYERGRRAKPFALWALLVVGALCAVGCAERRAERALQQVTATGRFAPPAETRAALAEIAQRWPQTAAAAKAREEIEWLDEFEVSSQRGKALLAWDAVRKVGRAAERHQVDRGRFPASFDELVPRYLPAAVVDPWGNPVDYRVIPGGYQAVSYGSDGIPGGRGEAEDILVENSQLKVESR